MLARDQRLPVLLLRDGKHRNADVVALAPLCGLAALRLALCGGRGGGAGLGRGGLGRRSPGALGWVRRRGEQAEAGPGEARAPQVADGVEAPLPLCRLRQRVGGVADGRVRDGAVVGLGLQVSVGEDLPAVCPSAVSNQAGRSLRGWERGRGQRQTAATSREVCRLQARSDAGLLTLSTSLVKGLVEFQLHHFRCSCGSGGRKSWKVRTLHALGLAPPPLSLLLLEPLGEPAASGAGQSPAGPGPVSLCRRNLSRC